MRAVGRGSLYYLASSVVSYGASLRSLSSARVLDLLHDEVGRRIQRINGRGRPFLILQQELGITLEMRPLRQKSRADFAAEVRSLFTGDVRSKNPAERLRSANLTGVSGGTDVDHAPEPVT